ncbi:MAG: hypothetical protein Q8P73_02250 [bacterium]|nr:hypothetical protein [bacterium]
MKSWSTEIASSLPAPRNDNLNVYLPGLKDPCGCGTSTIVLPSITDTCGNISALSVPSGIISAAATMPAGLGGIMSVTPATEPLSWYDESAVGVAWCELGLVIHESGGSTPPTSTVF